MVVNLTQRVCDAAKATDNRYDLRDRYLRGFFVRVEPSGRKTFYLCYRTPSGRLRNKKIISAAVATVAQARAMAQNMLLALIRDGKEPSSQNKKICQNVRELIDLYEPWVLIHRKSGKITIRCLKLFTEFFDMPADTIGNKIIEDYQNKNIGRIKCATINRRLAALSGLFSWAVSQGYMDAVPFKAKKLAHKDSKIVSRYLLPEERCRLMAALAEREEQRGRDYLMPAVLLAINTGIRKGTLLSLRVSDIDFELRKLTLRAEIMKAGKNCVIPLNNTAFTALNDWITRTKKSGDDYIFTAQDGHSKRNDIGHTFDRVLEKAGIKDFSWHTLRHDFASQLAINGTSLQTIQRLLCHSSISMTQRYAHLSDAALAEAVKSLT